MTRVRALVAAFVGCASMIAGDAPAESVIAARAIAGKSIVQPADLRLAEQAIDGALSDPAEAVGREARVTIYAGRPISAGDLRAPAIVERNDIVRLRYARGPLVIEADGRALDRGAVGDRISVMNMASRSVLVGVVGPDGVVGVAR
ncbi:MAG: flagellar basal body P-ring formation chaperone FlgA [Pseudomonadota bacterium]